MTIPKWLLPAFAIVAAIAVGIAGTLIGLRFQPTETVPVTPETIAAPVLAPLVPVDNADPDGERIWGLSDTIGSQDVAAPGTVLPDDLDLEAALDRFAGASDPAAELEVIEAAAEAPALGSGDDPCAPESGDAPEGCPPGAMGAIFALVTPPEFRVTGQAYPPTEDEYEFRGNPVGPLWCAPEDELGESDVPFGILTTVPATFTVLYWPEGRGDERRSLVAATPQNAEAWEEQFADATDASELPPLQRCVVLPDLEPDTAYRAQIIGSTPAGLMRLSGTIAFNSAGEPTRPPAEFSTLGQNYVFARALHPEDQRVEFRAFITNPPDGVFGGDESDVACPAGPSSLSAIAGQIYDVPAAEVLELNAPSDHTKRTAYVFRVPEGANVTFCARWYPAEVGLASWERNQPLFETSTSFGAPDRILPILTLDAGGPLPDIGRDIQLTVSTTEGVICGVTDLLVDGVVPRDNPVLCDPSVLATASARERDRRYWSQEFRGDLVLTTVLTKNDGATETNTALIPASRRNCFGECELPRPEVFGFFVGQPDFDCGSSTPFSLNRTPCVAIAGTEEFELAVDLTWTQGYTNGNRSWTQSEVVDGAADDDLFAFTPQMNTDERFEFTEVDPVTLTGSAELRLVTDRPVEYTVYVRNADGTGACQVNPFGPVTSAISGTSTGETVVTIDSLCRGLIFEAEVYLRDPATGTTAIWRADSTHTRWPGARSFFVIPGQSIQNLNYSWEVIESPEGLDWVSAAFRAPRATDRFANSAWEPCTQESDPMRGEGAVDTVLGTTSQFRFEFVGMRVARAESGTCGYFYGDYSSNLSFTVDLFTLMTTGEQELVIRPLDGMTVRVRVWIG